jgi:hypothetical protein
MARRPRVKKGKYKRKHVKCEFIGFKGSFLVFVFARQNFISSNAFSVYPIPFMQYPFFQDLIEILLYV